MNIIRKIIVFIAATNNMLVHSIPTFPTSKGCFRIVEPIKLNNASGYDVRTYVFSDGTHKTILLLLNDEQQNYKPLFFKEYDRCLLQNEIPQEIKNLDKKYPTIKNIENILNTLDNYIKKPLKQYQRHGCIFDKNKSIIQEVSFFYNGEWPPRCHGGNGAPEATHWLNDNWISEGNYLNEKIEAYYRNLIESQKDKRVESSQLRKIVLVMGKIALISTVVASMVYVAKKIYDMKVKKIRKNSQKTINRQVV